MHSHRKGRHRSRRTTRNRHFVPNEGWSVEARVERFVEPALLLDLDTGRSHGYELAEHLHESTGIKVDYGNLYRLLRALESEGIVTSSWDDDAPGRAKRTYELTDHGRSLLDAWAEALDQSNQRVAAFLDKYKERK